MKAALFVTLFGRTLIRQVQAMFIAGEQGFIYDPSDISTLFQDAAGTTPVTASGQSVRLMLDKSGRGNHATAPSDAARPVYTEAGGLKYLACNGTSSAMATASVDLTGTAKCTFVSGLRKLSDASARIVLEHGVGGVDAVATTINAPRTVGADYGIDLRDASAGTSRRITPVFYSAPITNIFSVACDRSQATPADELHLYVNDALSEDTATGPGVVGNFGNYPMNLFARGSGASLWFNGNFYGAVFNARATGISAAERRIMERWVNLNTQVTLA